MGVIGKFDTDSKALISRINAHEKFGSKDINEWIFKCLELSDGMNVIDIGCGTGKQSIPMAEIVGTSGDILSVDISIDSLNILSKEASKMNLEKRINLLQCNLDNLNDHLGQNKYDRVLASFSIYYSQNPKKIFETINATLKQNGIFFFCGPSFQNNIELKEFVAGIKRTTVEHSSTGSCFMEKTGQVLANDIFDKTNILLFENPLQFDSPDSLYSYWSSHNFYEPSIDDVFKSTAVEYFKSNKCFTTNKRVLGVKSVKQ